MKKNIENWLWENFILMNLLIIFTTFENISNLLKISKKDFVIPKKDIENFNKFFESYQATFNIKEMEMYNLNNIKSSFFNPGVDTEIDDTSKKIDDIKNIFSHIAAELSKLIDSGYTDLIKVSNTDKEGYHLTSTKKRWETVKKKKWTEKISYGDKKLVCDLTDMTAKQLTNSVKISSPLLEKLSSILVKLNRQY